jgi:hypothetical protein
MANWYGSARSNYFRVKDKDAFLKWADGRGISVFRNQENRDQFAIYAGASTDDCSWPSYNVEGDTEIDLVGRPCPTSSPRPNCLTDGNWRREAEVLDWRGDCSQ